MKLSPPTALLSPASAVSAFALALALFLAHTAPAADDLNWPEFRGPRGDGVSTSTGLPVQWSENDTTHVKWKTDIHGRGWSSPVIWGDQIWLSTATPDGRVLSAICVDKQTGKIVFDEKLFEIENPQYAHPFNSYASPTPAIQAGRVFVTFGSPGTACLDTKTGKVLWERRDIQCNHFRGAGSSPILDGGRIYLNFDGSDRQFVLALDQETGKTLWRADRSIDFKDLTPEGKVELDGDMRKAYATCRIATFDGIPELLSEGAKAMYAYDPATGSELWRVEERSSQAAGTRPAVGLGLVFVPSGWSQGQVLAIRPGKKGESLDANAHEKPDTQLQIAWKYKKSVPKKPSLTFHDDLLYAIDENGVATCWDAATGSVIWNERIGGNYSASPILADGRLYFCSEDGKITAVATGRQFAKLGESQMSDGFMSSPAVSGKALYLRSKTKLYRIENE
jgi:outer membrane protein assembly factor BamB